MVLESSSIFARNGRAALSCRLLACGGQSFTLEFCATDTRFAIGIILFIISEVFAFLSIFWGFFHSSLSWQNVILPIKLILPRRTSCT
jgi:hypothetical protein